MAQPITGEQSTTDEEVARLREENLRLRDLLIARDAELGSLKGQVIGLYRATGAARLKRQSREEARPLPSEGLAAARSQR